MYYLTTIYNKIRCDTLIDIYIGKLKYHILIFDAFEDVRLFTLKLRYKFLLDDVWCQLIYRINYNPFMQ